MESWPMKEQIFSLACAALFAACAYESQAKGDTKNWRPLSQEELTKQQWRSASKTGFASVSLDVNGDRVPDKATLVVSGDAKQSGIELCYGANSKSEAAVCTIIAAEENAAEVMGLEKKKPGCYEYNEDEAGISSNGKKACSRNDILEYFRFGSAGSFFIYDRESNAFKRYWDSD